MDPLKYIFKNPIPIGKHAKWKILLREFDIVYVTQKTVKAHALADHMAKSTVDDDYRPLKTYFSDEKWILWDNTFMKNIMDGDVH